MTMMTHLSLSERIAESRRRGNCRECGAETEVFLGKTVCDACVLAKADSERREKRLTRLRRLVSEGKIYPDTQYAWTRWRQPGKTNAKACKAAMDTAKNIWLWGPPGVGKSHLARVKLVRAVSDGMHEVAEVTAHRLVKVGTLFNEGEGRFDTWKRAGLLLLDDIDKVAWRRDQVPILWELLDERASNKRQTIVTANCKPSAFAKWLTEGPCSDNHDVAAGALDRLKPVSVLELKGPSRR